MKKVLRDALTLLCALVCLTALLPQAAQAEAVFAFEQLTYTVSTNKSLTLTPILQGAEQPAKAKLVWSSSDDTVARVKNGHVTGVAAGTATITVSMTEGDATLYEARCTMEVVQPVTKITYKDKELKIGLSSEIRFAPTVLPEDATNKTLRFTSSDETMLTVTADGVLKPKGSYGTCYVTAEATDGSGVKLKQKIRLETFVIPEDEIIITERKTFRLNLPVISFLDSYFFRYKKSDLYRLSGIEEDENNWGYITAKWAVDGAKTYGAQLRIDPVKAGKTTLTLMDWAATWGDNTSKHKLTITIKPSAVYGAEAFPQLKYAAVSGDPAAAAGQTVSFTGYVTDVREKSGGKSYMVATRSKTEDTLLVQIPADFADKSHFNTGEKVTVYGAFAAPLEEVTETGLKRTTLVVVAEKINDDIYNSELLALCVK